MVGGFVFAACGLRVENCRSHTLFPAAESDVAKWWSQPRFVRRNFYKAASRQ